MISALFSVLFLLVGLVIGWNGCEKFYAYIKDEDHEFDKIFKENPHPEIYMKDGKIDRGEYMFVSFDLGYDPDDFEPEDIVEDY